MIEGGEGDRTPKAKVVKRKLDGKERDRERLEGSQEVLVLGDSRIRYLDESFCEADRERRMTVLSSWGQSAGRGREIQEGSGEDGKGDVSGGSCGSK